MLDASTLDKMIEAPDADAAMKALGDSPLAGDLDDYLASLKAKLAPMIPEASVRDAIFGRFDFHNAKLLFKEKITGRDLGEHLSPLGQTDVAKMREFIVKENRQVRLPDEVEEAVRQAQRKLKEPGFMLDAFLDKHCLLDQKEKARQSGSAFLSQLAEKEIAAANAKTLLRAKKLKIDAARIGDYLIETPDASVAFLLVAYKKEMADLARECSRLFADAQVKEALKKFGEHQEVWRLEKELDNFETRSLRPTKYLGYGPEVVLAHFLASAMAAKNLRLVLGAKASGVPSQEIRLRAREVF